MKSIKNILQILKSKSFWISFAIIFALKCLYLLIFKPTIEVDSWGYVECIFHFFYPPYYGYFLYILRNIFADAYFTCLVQILFFSVCASFFNLYLNKNQKYILWFAILFGLEPATSYYSTTFMSEALFIPVLLIWTIIIHHTFSKSETRLSDFLLIGIIGGLLYSVRYAGQIITIVPFILILFFKEHRKNFWLKYLFILIGFQVAIFPVRYKFKQNFDTYQINAFTGPVLWNNASAIYPFSDVRKNPKNDFEKYLATIPDSVFTDDLALRARQLWEDTLPMKQYYKKCNIKFEDAPKLNGMMIETAFHVISNKPWMYFTNYVIHNFTKIFKEENTMYAAGYEQYFLEKYNYKISPKPIIHKYLFSLYLLILIGLTVMYFFKKMNLKSSLGEDLGGLNKFILINLIFAWFYILLLAFVSILDSRLYLILAINIIAVGWRFVITTNTSST